MARKTNLWTLPLIWILVIGSVGALAADSAPQADNLEISTCRGEAAEGQLTAYDPEDDVLRFFVTTEPVKGTLELDPDGSFLYTPGEGKKGRDYFGYRVENTRGVQSQEATVIIRIEKCK